MSADSTPAGLTFSVTSLFAKQQENAIKAVLRDAIIALAERYSFDADDAVHWLEVERPLTMEEKKMARKAKTDSDADSTDSKKKTIPLPWMGLYDGNCCQGIAYNYGLFTQCQKKKAVGNFCSACDKISKETESGDPPCGTISKRISSDNWAEYTDSKGRKPTSYGKVLYKLKISMSDAIAFAVEKGFAIPDCHLEEYVPADSKGRPKKGDKEVTATGELFDSLVENSSTSTSGSKGKKLSPEEKLAREEKRKQEKAEKEHATALKKQHETTAKALAAIGRDVDAIMSEGVPQEIAEAAVQKHNETQEKKAELAKKREEEKAIKKAAADEKKAEEKAKKAAEKEAEKQAKIEAAKAAAAAKKPSAKATAPATVAQVQAVAPAAQAVKVQRINAAGEVVKKGTPGGDYLRDSNNVVYNADTKQPVGKWSEEENKIIFDSEEEEETI